MSELWYCIESNETRGPIEFDPLIEHLSQLPTYSGILVWREGLADWTAAENVPEIVETLVQPATSISEEGHTLLLLDQKANTLRWIALVVASVFVLLIGAYFASQIYNNSAEGIIAAREGQAALQDITDSQRIDEALGQPPSNKFLQMLATAKKAASETGVSINKLSDEIEPKVSKDFDPRTASRSELEALRRDVQTAETNAATFMSRCRALFITERDKMESYALSLSVDKDAVSGLLSGIDSRHAKIEAFNSKMMLARAEFYRAYKDYLTFLIGEFGTYKVVDGQFIFPERSTADRFNALVSTVTAAGKRVADLGVERNANIQSD